METIIVELVGEPKGKGRPRFSRASGHAFTPAATRSYEGALRFAAQQAMAGRPPVDGPLRTTMIATFPIPASWSKKKTAAALAQQVYPTKKPDADNLLKCLDALNEVVFRDDAQIIDARIFKEYGERPCLRIEVRGATP